MSCDWEKPQNPCPDFKADPRERLPQIAPDEEGFEQIKGKMCIVRFPHGRVFRGRPVSITPEDFILVETGEGEMVVVEFGHGAEIYLVE